MYHSQGKHVCTLNRHLCREGGPTSSTYHRKFLGGYGWYHAQDGPFASAVGIFSCSCKQPSLARGTLDPSVASLHTIMTTVFLGPL